MRDPVKLVQSGITYDREYLCESLLRDRDLCPETGIHYGEMLEYEDDVAVRLRLTFNMGESAYQRYDDSAFRRQYAALWGNLAFSAYRKIARLLYGMNLQQIDWLVAQEVASKACREDAVMAGFKALLLHPDVFPSNRLRKDNNESLRTWLSLDLRLSNLIDEGNPWAQWINGMFLDIVEEDYDSAKHLYQLAANQGHALAQISLGALYDDDEDSEKGRRVLR